MWLLKYFGCLLVRCYMVAEVVAGALLCSY